MRTSSLACAIGKVFGTLQKTLNWCVMAQNSSNLRRRFAEIGTNSQLAPDLQADFAERIQIGDWVYVGPESQLFGRGGIAIGDHVIFGPRVTIMSSMHNFRSARLAPYDEVELLDPVRIEVGSWIGFGVILMPGVTLGCGCVVGAGSIVTKSFPEGSIVAGNPAKQIGMRDLRAFSKQLADGRTYLKNKVSQKLEKIEQMPDVWKRTLVK